MTSYDGLLRRARVRTSTRPHGRGTAVSTPAAKVRHVLLEIRFLEGDRDLNNHYEGCAPLALQRMRERM